MNRCLIACALTVAALLTVGTWSDGAAAQTRAVPQSAGKKSAAPSAGRIACTEQGCHPVPRGCYIETESWPPGHATGYDKIVCPAR
jgi:hypothetical protein